MLSQQQPRGRIDSLTVSLSAAALVIAVGACCKTSRGEEDGGLDAGGCLTEPCAFHNDQTVYVDSVGGHDDGGCCCGAQGNPCQSLTYTMNLIGTSQAHRVTIQAFNSDHSLAWTADESWPIPLGMGVTLTAPDLYFNPPMLSNVFEAFSWDGGTELPVTVQGDPVIPGRYIHVGLPLPSDSVTRSNAIVSFENGGGTPSWVVPLRLSNAWIHAFGVAVDIETGGSLVLGPLPVHIGSNDGRQPVERDSVGIYCASAPGLTSLITDLGDSTVQIDSQGNDLSILGGCVVTLVHGPRLGRTADGGFKSCPNASDAPEKADYYGVVATGLSVVTLGSLVEPATISCDYGDGIYMVGDADSFPVVSFSGVIHNANCLAAYLASGMLVATQSTFRFNRSGVWVDGTGSLRMSGGGDISCNSLQEFPACLTVFRDTPPGVGVIDTTSGAMVTSDLSWGRWDADAGAPDLWTCMDSSFQSCTCAGAFCADGGTQPLPTGIDAVTVGDATRFDFDGGYGSSSPCP